jgi:hypothetical protein
MIFFTFSERFERIRADPLQRKAAECIARNVMTVISGRGGTGKTEVKLFYHNNYILCFKTFTLYKYPSHYIHNIPV